MAGGEVSVHIATGGALKVRQFDVHERISSLFTVHLVAVSDDPDLDFDAVVGKPASFSLQGNLAGARTRVWSGVCNHLQLAGASDDGRSTYELTIVPRLWLLTQRRGYRVFQHASEVDIALDLLEGWGIEPRLVLARAYDKHGYRAQYGESDYAFLCRMLEDAGVSFYFAPDDGDARLTLSDSPERASLRGEKLPYVQTADLSRDAEHVTALRISQRARPSRAALLDEEGRRPAGDEPPPSVAIPSTSQSGARIYAFQTNAHDIGPGVVLRIASHPRAELGPDKRLLVVQSTLRGTSRGDFSHRCEAQSAELPYRPELSTSKPKVSGVEIATVSGPLGEEVPYDELGRIEVRFHWDREPFAREQSGCSIPVSRPWGGAALGSGELPRGGQEVIVDFVRGDPDKPIIVGRVLAPHDPRTTGEERATWVEGSESVTVTRDRTRVVRMNEREVTGQSRSVVVGLNRSTQIGMVDTTTVGARHAVMVTPPEGNEGEPTSWAMAHDTLCLTTTGGARIVMEGPTIRIEAGEGGDVFIVRDPPNDPRRPE